MNTTQPISVACIGGAHWDHKALLAQPVEFGSSNPTDLCHSLGGVARNVAENLALLGCDVALFSVLGDDASGRELTAAMTLRGVDCAGLSCADGYTTANYTAVLDPDGSLVLALADMAIYETLDATWAQSIKPRLTDYAIWVLDANITAAGLKYLLQGPDRASIVLVDPVSVAKSARLVATLGGVEVLFPDSAEAAALSGVPASARTPGYSSTPALAAADRLCALGVGTVIVSHGAAGIVVSDGRDHAEWPAYPVDRVRDVTGAGDAFLAGYAYGLINGHEGTPESFGLAAASLTVEVEATVDPHITPERLRQRKRRNE
ncbi:MAG: carbohydrate kinase family protein [Alphaproteobacteria bacterium]